MKFCLSFVFVIFISGFSLAQSKVSFVFKDSASTQLLPKASVAENGINIGIADDLGKADITLKNGNYRFTFSSINYQNQSLNLILTKDTTINVLMISKQQNLNDVVVVSTTRNNQPIENAPIKIEVLGKEEMNEESTIKPASIASILGDVSGVQVLQSSATSGNMNVNI